VRVCCAGVLVCAGVRALGAEWLARGSPAAARQQPKPEGGDPIHLGGGKRCKSLLFLVNNCPSPRVACRRPRHGIHGCRCALPSSMPAPIARRLSFLSAEYLAAVN
jgi:hypothetical protein